MLTSPLLVFLFLDRATLECVWLHFWYPSSGWYSFQLQIALIRNHRCKFAKHHQDRLVETDWFEFFFFLFMQEKLRSYAAVPALTVIILSSKTTILERLSSRSLSQSEQTSISLSFRDFRTLSRKGIQCLDAVTFPSSVIKWWS